MHEARHNQGLAVFWSKNNPQPFMVVLKSFINSGLANVWNIVAGLTTLLISCFIILDSRVQNRLMNS